MLDLLVWAFWAIFGAYCFWYFTQARTFQPITLEDLALTWKLHKQTSGCKASRIHNVLTRNDEVVGYRCDCGHEYLQTRLITQKPRSPTNMRPPKGAIGSPLILELYESFIKENQHHEHDEGASHQAATVN